MASSSSSIPTPTGGCKYDVFLSFRGEDTRYNFVDHLHAALHRSKLLVFKDDKMVQGGKEISSELLEAIKGSTCAVVVLSKTYANSSWCLAELAEIMECRSRMGQVVIPVFYHVDPSDVRRQKRDFRAAFRQHESEFREEMDNVNKWKEALTKVGKLSGHHISETIKVGESAFINKIVQNILDHIQPRLMENNLIGIESRLDDLKSLLDLEATQEVRIVGICGMGGIGKTTIAQALFVTISHEFEGSSFVQGVREKSKSSICALQGKILEDITNHKYSIEDPKAGAEKLRRFLNQKVLLVLDDVDDVDQLEFLPARHEWFSSGSRIIITTRDEHLLSDTDAIYKPRTLPKEQAVELFSRHAFHEKTPPKGYEKLSDRAICYTSGLPLALKVLGSSFHGEQACVWDSALNRLAERPNRKIFETLKISFDGLCDYDKKIFLDVACFFKGKDEERVRKVLDSFGFHAVMGINVLIKKSLITVSNNRLDMHDMLQEMGLEIVRESYSNTRLWHYDEIHDIITKNKNLEAIEGIVMAFHDDVGFNANIFGNMINLRLLDIDGEFTCCEPTILPRELRWLRWSWYPFPSLPLANRAKLVGLEMENGEIKELWKGPKDMKYLEFIDFVHMHSLKRFPDISRAPNVKSLFLVGCTNLVEVHNSLGSHRRLVYLNVSGCVKLKCLPFKIEMESLETLILSGCSRLEKFPEVSPCMVKLSNIYLDDCTSLDDIPNSICELKGLKILNLCNCPQLQKLPTELGSMGKLEELYLGFTSSNTASKRQSESIDFRTLTTLRCLRKLDLSWRQIEDMDFLNDLHAFSSLEELYLNGNSRLIQLPASLSHVSRLKHLELNDCPQLQNIPVLPLGIQVLRATNCKALEKIGDLTKEYMWLYKIWLSGCEKLVENEENKRCLDNMLQQSFVKKCATLGRRLSVFIPTSKIPSWFKEQRYGSKIVLKLHPQWHTSIMGFAVCGMYQGRWRFPFQGSAFINFRIENNGTLKRESKVDCINASTTVDDGCVWVAYIPFNLFQQQMYADVEGENWSRLVEGTLLISVVIGFKEIVRSGAHIVYKRDVESIQQIKTCIPEYQNSDSVHRYNNIFEYRENYRSIDQ